MDRSNHYEEAFEAYLRDARLTYVAVDETRRSTLDDEPVKSLDFIVHGRHQSKWLIDIKGRKFPSGNQPSRGYHWQNWVMREDVDGLLRWQSSFGEGHRGLLVFMYCLHPSIVLPLGTADLWFRRGNRYLIRGVTVDDYVRSMRLRSKRWRTVHLPSPIFRELVRPFSHFIQERTVPLIPRSISGSPDS